jgi:DNA-binding Lrp family transcriptional regulator
MTYENLDAKLVNALLGNGRASLRSLGEDLDVSVTTVSNHLRDLEEEGVIEGYTPRVNYDKLGYDVTAIGKFHDTDEMNDGIKGLLADADIRETNTSVVLNTVVENAQFDLDVE